jgi:hypothetical protein
VQLTDLKTKLGWKGSAKRPVKSALKPGEPVVNTGNVPMHGGIC